MADSIGKGCRRAERVKSVRQEWKKRDPDVLLQKAIRETRGRLTVFLGAAAGVGKTCAMLQAAKEQIEAGRDLVIGWVETHGRQDTAAMQAGFSSIPPKKLVYRGKDFLEMDLDAILKRQPQIVLVDELAHTNVKGSRHIRRFQDVEELLAAGIEVYTTLNVQHIESLKDIVEHITGIRIWETVPDAVLENADRVQLIDIAPQDLRQRLEDGKIYAAPQAERALQGFFREGNISALRELALRFTAQRVDQQMDEYMQDHAIKGPWPAREKIMVCVSVSPFSADLIRAAKRMAAAQKVEWYALHIQTGKGEEVDELNQERLQRNLRLAAELGSIVVARTGSNIVQQMLDFAREKNIAHILVGKPLCRSWRDWLRGGDLVDRLIKQSSGIQIHVIHGQKEADPARRIKVQPHTPEKNFGSYGKGLGMLLLVTALCQAVGPLELVNTVMLYLLPVLLSAFWWGRGPSYSTAIFSVILIDLLYIPPLYSFSITDIRFLWTGLIFLLVGFVAGGQTERLRREVALTEAESRRTQALYEFSRDIAGTVDLHDIVEKLVQTAEKALQREVVVFLPDDDGKLKMAAQSGGYNEPKINEWETITWVFAHGQPAGKFTDTVPSAEYMYLPLQAQDKRIGVLALQMVEKRMYAEQSRLIEAWTHMAALAIERIELTREASRAALLAESERLSTALLNSISHELKTPLAAILGSVSTLQDQEIAISESIKNELYDGIKTSSMRMERIVSNLLDTARLESGAMKIKNDWCDMQDIVGVALHHMQETLGQRKICTHIPAGLPLVRGDCVLLEQVLVNLLDNANKYSPPEQPIEISVAHEDQKLAVSVADFGDAIPDKEMELIFHKFYRGSKKETAPGTGLGLSICKSIIEIHGGQIWVVNLIPHGKRFIFTLPEEKNDGEQAKSFDC